MAGRLIGWLMVSDEPCFTAADLASVLQASKGSISTTTRLLEHGGMLERFTVPGDRKTYFRLKPRWWVALFARRAVTLKQTGAMVEDWIEKLAGTSSELLARLSEMRDFYAFLDRELPRLLERWSAQSRATGERYPR
jgi:DNA-binding transcriptional regulator GbsR (MarR family)